MIRIFRINKELLTFDDDFPVVDYRGWDLPILIDDDFNVLLGNLFRNNLPSKVLVIKADKYKEQIKDFALNLENALADENSFGRFEGIKKELKEYLSKSKHIEMNIDNFSLVDFNSCRDDEMISPDNYIQPSEYSFEKKKKNRKKEELLLDPDQYDTDLLKESTLYENMSRDARK
jgi:hypothetical protein